MHLQADACVELWNGEVLPLGPDARDDIRIRIGSPGAIGRLIRSPRLTTLVEVYLSGDLDITGASPLDALQRWDHLKAVGLKRAVDRADDPARGAALPDRAARRVMPAYGLCRARCGGWPGAGATTWA